MEIEATISELRRQWQSLQGLTVPRPGDVDVDPAFADVEFADAFDAARWGEAREYLAAVNVAAQRLLVDQARRLRESLTTRRR